MAFANLLIFLFLIPVTFNYVKAGIMKSASMPSFTSVNSEIPKAPSYPRIWENLTTGEHAQIYSPTLDYAIKSARRLTNATGAWLKQLRTKSENVALRHYDDIEEIKKQKQIDKYAKILNKIDKSREIIASQQILERKNAQIKANLEKMMRGYKSDYTVGDRQHWMQARRAMLNNMKNLVVDKSNLAELNAKADKFPTEVKAGYNQRKSAERQLEESWHGRNFFIGDQYGKK